MNILLAEWIFGILLIFSSLGVIVSKKPVTSSLWFLVTLLILAVLYLELSAEFIAIMQVLVYAGAILVIFMFVIVLFQDAYKQIEENSPKSQPILLYTAAGSFILMLIFLGSKISNITTSEKMIPQSFGTVEGLGLALYLDFFFPFEAVILLFLVAIVGALYIGKKVI